ncbi:hypothetical protein [Weissella koreensis]|uniref:hypothetical protein n=1 Tax=Weissella koreensis TaxID=165096 RepID=UPI001FAC0ED2|nr:hypothetical protein [Weissella koreensis]
MMSEHLCVQFVPLFQKLKQADQEEIEKLINHVVVQKGEVVYAPNDSQQLIILESGRLKVENLMENGMHTFKQLCSLVILWVKIGYLVLKIIMFF